MMSLPAEPPTPPTRTSEALRAELQEVNAQLDTMRRSWEDERRQLLGDNAVLQDAATRLNAQVRDVKDELRKAERAGERARAGIEGVSIRWLRTDCSKDGLYAVAGARQSQTHDGGT